MITAITYQYQFSRKYDNENLQYVNPMSTTKQLEELLDKDAEVAANTHRLVAALNRIIDGKNNTIPDAINSSGNEIIDLFVAFLGKPPRVTNVTKKRRRYSLCGLTVHEEDI